MTTGQWDLFSYSQDDEACLSGGAPGRSVERQICFTAEGPFRNKRDTANSRLNSMNTSVENSTNPHGTSASLRGRVGSYSPNRIVMFSWSNNNG